MDQSEGPMNLGNLKNNLWDWYESTPGLSMFKTCRLKNWINDVIIWNTNFDESEASFDKYKSLELWDFYVASH